VIGTRLRSRGRRWSDRLRRSDRGAAAVEFALIVPVLTMLTLGILDAGLLFFKWTAIGQGARAGARAVSEQPADDYADYYALRAASAVLTAIAPEDVLRVVVYKAGPDTDGDGNPLTILDEAALQQIIRQLIRDELKGVLGERITHSVRKLVRAEIKRALAAQALD